MRGLKPSGSDIADFGQVASFTDAWIETSHYKPMVENVESHLLQMRGLKLPSKHYFYQRCPVASFTDAWIETSLNQ